MHRRSLFLLLSAFLPAFLQAQERSFINPPDLSKPHGYSHVVAVPAGGKTLYVSGQMALDKDGNLVGKGDFQAQAEQVFANLDKALKASGASFKDVVRLDIYMTDATKTPELRIVRDKYIDTAHPPASTLVEVKRLVRDDVLLEVDVTAVVP
ncbi:MAG TPA: RidA family protein [Dyella sp.]|uniref:RidA family protein n=1 Tax=Dyella sp. TaxID=1869338 RepID=UPI002F957CC0